MRLSLVKFAGVFLVIFILSVLIHASELVTYEGKLEGFGEKNGELTLIIKNDTNEYKTAVSEDGSFKIENIQPGEYQQYIIKGTVEVSTSPQDLTESKNLTIVRTVCGVEIGEWYIDSRVEFTSDDVRRMGQGDPNQYLYLHPGVAVTYNDFNYSRYSSKPVYPPYIHVRGGRHYYTDYFFNGVSFRDPFSGILNATFIPEVEFFNFIPGNQKTAIGNDLSGFYSFETERGWDKFSGMIELKTDNLYSTSFDHNYYTMAFSGPLIDPDYATFSIAAKRTYLGDKNPSPKTDELYGVDQLPNNSFSNYAISGRVDLSLSPDIHGNIIYDGSFSYYQDYIHYFNNPVYTDQIEHTPRYEDKNYAISSNWDYQLTENDKLSLSVVYFKSESKKGDGILFDNLEAYSDFTFYPQYDNYSLFREGVEDLEYIPSVYTKYAHNISSYNQLQAEYVRQLTNDISLTTGLAYKKYTVRNYDNAQVGLSADIQTINYGFDSNDNISDNENYLTDRKNPTLFSFYAESKMIFDQITIFPGFRIDRFDYDALVIKNPAYPFSPDGTSDEPLDFYFDEGDFEEAPTYTKFSPRIRSIIRLNDYAKLRFAFRHNYQFLPFEYIYNDWNYVEKRLQSGSYFPVRNAGMEPVKSQQVELGLDLNFGEGSSIGATVYQYDYRNELRQQYTFAFPYVYDRYVSGGESRGRGIEFYLNYNEHQYFDLMLRADYNNVQGPYDGTDQSYNIIWKNSAEADLNYYDLAYERAMNAYCQLNVYPEHLFDLSLLFSYIDGSKYAPGTGYDFYLPTAEYNSGAFDGSFRIDLHLEKEIKLGQFEFIPYLTINNLLDEEIINFVYNTSGLPDETGYLDTEEGQLRAEDLDYLYRYQIWEANPRHYNPPRQIFTGIRISF